MEKLTETLRPKTLDEVLGQGEIVKFLKAFNKDTFIPHFIFQGNPATGKTSTALAFAKHLELPTIQLNAAVDDKKSLVDALSKSERTIIIIDEIHRLDKQKQDLLLMHMEKGVHIIIGTTTENAYIRLSWALRSRATILKFAPIEEETLNKIIKNACLKISEDAKHYLIQISGFNARTLLQNIDICKTHCNVKITKEILEKLFQAVIPYKSFDKDGDNHYDLLSALQKSIRGSDLDASLYYLARLLQGGDMESVVRRLQIIAFEDIGIAAPNLMSLTVSACIAAQNTGLPEAGIPLALAVTELALAPKSNTAYEAFSHAMASVDPSDQIPNNLRDAHYKGASDNGVAGYIYPPDTKERIPAQQYLPDNRLNDSYFDGINLKDKRSKELYEIYKYLRNAIHNTRE